VNEAKPRLGACLDRAGFVGVDDGVDAVADVELAQDVRDVRLDGALADDELRPAANDGLSTQGCASDAEWPLSAKPLDEIEAKQSGLRGRGSEMVPRAVDQRDF